MEKKLNLGCGEFKKKGYINLDFSPQVKPDIIHDLNKFPYPFKDNEFDLIESDHVLEHLENPFEVMKELYRICNMGGKIIIRVPHFSRGFTHPEHKCGFDVSFPYYFNPDFKGGYSGMEFKLLKVRFTWFAQQYLKKTVLSKPTYILCKICGDIIDFFANLSPLLASRIWVFMVGGFDEIEFVFQKPF